MSTTVRSNRPIRYVAATLATNLAVSLGLVAGVAASSTAAPAASPYAVTTERAAAPTTWQTVARSPQGVVRSRVEGTAANGRQVTGRVVPLRFVKRNGRVLVRALVEGVVRAPDGRGRTFSALRTLRVATVNGTPATAGRRAAAPSCDVLRLRLGPLDLDLLGLRIELNRVLLNVIAQTGAGQLLGNLVCAVAGLLDGGLNGLLGRVTRLLNRILGQLGLGI